MSEAAPAQPARRSKMTRTPLKIDLEVSESLPTEKRNKVVRRRSRRSAKRNLKKLNRQAAPYVIKGPLQRKMAEHLARSGVNLNRKFNLYEQMLLDPMNGPLVCYPDEYSGLTKVVRLITQKRLQFNSAGVASGRVYADLGVACELDSDGTVSVVEGPFFENVSQTAGDSADWFVNVTARADAALPAPPHDPSHAPPAAAPAASPASPTPEGPPPPVKPPHPNAQISVQAGSYALANGTGMFFLRYGNSYDGNRKVELVQYSTQLGPVECMPCNAGDTFTPRFFTSNTTANNFNAWLLRDERWRYLHCCDHSRRCQSLHWRWCCGFSFHCGSRQCSWDVCLLLCQPWHGCS